MNIGILLIQCIEYQFLRLYDIGTYTRIQYSTHYKYTRQYTVL